MPDATRSPNAIDAQLTTRDASSNFETLDLTIFTAVRKASANRYRRGQIAIALIEYACQLVDCSYDQDRDLAMAAMALRLRMLQDDWMPGDGAALTAERDSLLLPDRRRPERRIVPRCLIP